jgi:GNAT superfamily N-acetyltransferase
MINIRPITLNDRSEWDTLWSAYLAYYETDLPAEIYDTTFLRLLNDDPNDFKGLVAEKDGKLIGLTHYLFHRHGWKIENVCYLQDLFVSPDVRGTGAGRKLIEAVYEAADHANAPAVYWLTQDFNSQARQLYDRIGQHTPFIKYSRV